MQAADAAAQSRYQAQYPQAKSKKGLQVEIVDDAIALGIEHAAINVNLTALIDPTNSQDSPRWNIGDKSFAFHAEYLANLDRQIKPISDLGILVNVILLTYQSGDAQIDSLLIHPDCMQPAPNRLGAFNTVSDDGSLWIAATVQFLAERWGRPDQHFGRVVGWIVGNEVNSHWWWNNQGNASFDTVVADYSTAVRLVHTAVRSQTSWGRVYVSLEHHWTIRYPPATATQAFPARDFLLAFAGVIKQNNDIDWHIAFHPYPENLFEPRFWNDASATHCPDSPRVTFKNLEVLEHFLQRQEMQFNNMPRRVILSEQGFHCADDIDGELIQAAAYCYAYRLIENNASIDAFILHRHVDHPHEGGLHLGLRRCVATPFEARPKKMIYDCFLAADSPQWERKFAFALPLIGLHNWSKLTESLEDCVSAP